MKLLDLFCGAGGASVGYARAGFIVTGVDIAPHDDYPFEIHVRDAMKVLQDKRFLSTFDVIAASPPCQRYSTMTHHHNRDKHPDLVEPVREALQEWGGTYVIENVPRSPLIDPVKLCGSYFGLGVRRHRLFESNADLVGTPCDHKSQGQVYGVYGSHPDSKRHLRPDGRNRGVKARSLAHAQEIMGISWMSDYRDLCESIPPAYTEYLGTQLMEGMLHG